MNKKGLSTLIGIICLMLILAALPFMAACAQPAPTGPITLKALSFLPTFIEDVYFLGIFADRVTERANGELIIEWVGGPEVIGMHDQAEALKTGVIDILATPSTFYMDLVPSAIVTNVSNLTRQQERDTGFYDILVEAHEEANMHYLGRISSLGLYLFLDTQVEKPEDMAGLKMATSSTFVEMMRAFNVVPVDIEEEYMGMERGVVDGAGGSLMQAAGGSWFEVANYWIDHSIYGPFGSGVMLLVNLDTWNQLPRHLQDLIEDTLLEMEPEIRPFFEGVEAEAIQQLIDGGATPIKFSPEDATRYIDVSHEAMWAGIERKVGPQMYKTLRETVAKAK